MSDPIKLKYDLRGVSATKDEVHSAIKNLDKGLFPNAFCKILHDIAAGDPEYCNLMHADTAGTKTSLAYIYWKETGDISVWRGIVEDAIIMNLDDLACVGCLDGIILSSTIGRNKQLIPGEVISEIINHTQTFISKMNEYGIGITLAGGETADVGDVVRTIDVGYTAFARMKRSDVIDIDISEGQYIVGLCSYGKADYEESYNGGMGSNGLTSARHDVFYKEYAQKYPESYSPEVSGELIYAGSKKLTDSVTTGSESITAGKLVLSPTRTYMPVLRRILESGKESVKGIIHCSGGGQTKVMKFVKNNVAVIKDNLFIVPPLFELIHQESGASMFEMYRVFNMGHRLEIYTPDRDYADHIIRCARSLSVDAQIIGRVEKSDKPKLIISADGKDYEYFD